MGIIERFTNCDVEDKALLSLAVLLDGYDAADFLIIIKEKGSFYAKIAKELASIPVETRNLMLGTILREVKKELIAK